MDIKLINKLKRVVILIVMCLILSGCSKNSDEIMEIESVEETDNETEELQESYTDVDKDIKSADEYVYIHVCGAVINPGVYKLKMPVRVYEAIEAAGGITEDGLDEVINQAREVVDGEQIYIPTLEDKENGNYIQSENSIQEKKTDGRININTASEEELMTLPGIGKSKAESIIKYRTDNGKFNSVEELMNIQGIKDGVFTKIKDKISI